MPCLPLLGMLLLSAACFCEYCWADRRAASIGVSAAFCGSSGVFFLYEYLLLVLSTCCLLWFSLNSKHNRAKVMLVKIVYDCACCQLCSKYGLSKMVRFSTFHDLTPKREWQNTYAIFTVFWEHYFSISSKLLKLNWIKLNLASWVTLESSFQFITWKQTSF